MKPFTIFVAACVLTVTSYAQNQASVNQIQSACDSLNTLYAYTYLNHGAMFNVVAKKNNIQLSYLSANIKNGTNSYSLYYKTGSYLGNESSQSSWTLINTVSVTSNNTLTINNVPTQIPINISLNMNLGDTIAFYLVSPTLARVYLTSTTIPFTNEAASDSALSISTARSIYQFYGTPFSTPQIWNGTVAYCDLTPVGVEDIEANQLQISQLDNTLLLSIPNSQTTLANKVKFTLLDMYGHIAMQDFVSNDNSSFDVSSVSKGVYVCQVSIGSTHSLSKKIVIR
jgi:hypothetical protein